MPCTLLLHCRRRSALWLLEDVAIALLLGEGLLLLLLSKLRRSACGTACNSGSADALNPQHWRSCSLRTTYTMLALRYPGSATAASLLSHLEQSDSPPSAVPSCSMASMRSMMSLLYLKGKQCP